MLGIRRRDVIAFLSGGAAWPLAARAQQPDGRLRRIGVLSAGSFEDDSVTRADLAALRGGLAKLGWVEGRNLRIDLRFTGNDPDRIRAYAAELISLAPEVIVTGGGATTRGMREATQTIPIVFTAGNDPVSNGLLQNIARPEGNTTGFTSTVDSLIGKWMGLLKEVAPHMTRVALIFVPGIVSETYFAAIYAAEKALGVKAMQGPYRNGAELERAIDSFAAENGSACPCPEGRRATELNGGLVVVPPAPGGSNGVLINQLALKYRLPTITANKYDAANGTLISYGTDSPETIGTVASYVDRLLRGAKVSELPVQFPTKFEMAVNLKTAKALGLAVPPSILLRADEVIE
jgi:putative ABC transport system substrate-binding protein